MNTALQVKKEINKKGSKERGLHSQRFFKTGKGEYGEGDIFMGLTMPEQRTIAKKYEELHHVEVQKLLNSKIHEHRMVGLIILTLQYLEASESEKKKIYILYINNTKNINNWDLVDVTTPRIVGAYLFKHNRSVIYKLAKSTNLWERRISILATFYFIRQRQLEDTYKLAEILLEDEHDLMHKAVGWMLREAGKIDHKRLEIFLSKHASKMPRTMLRYSIEKFSESKRQKYLKMR